VQSTSSKYFEIFHKHFGVTKLLKLQNRNFEVILNIGLETLLNTILTKYNLKRKGPKKVHQTLLKI
jgi:hypothetical protein